MCALPYGTPVRITRREHTFYGRDAWITGDNWIDFIEPTPGVRRVIYGLHVLTTDGQAVEGAWAYAEDVEVRNA